MVVLVSDMRDQIKDDLKILGDEYNSQIVTAIQAALRQSRGKRYWFLERVDTLSATVGIETVSLPVNYSAPWHFDLIAQGTRFKDGSGFDFLTFTNLDGYYYNLSPLPQCQPMACAVFNNTLYLSSLADQAYSIKCYYYAQDTTMPAVTETSIWFDDGYDAIRTLAQYIFKRDSQNMTLNEADSDMVNDTWERLNNTHLARSGGR